MRLKFVLERKLHKKKRQIRRSQTFSIESHIYNILYDNRPSTVSTTIRFMRTRSSKYDLALGPEKTDGIMNKTVGGKSGLEFRFFFFFLNCFCGVA